MTGLYNHNSFWVQLENQVKIFNNDTELCLAIIDIDDFKKVNDTYGHDCGDIVLNYMATTLKEYCNDNITAYRYGGEEFAVLLSGVNIIDATDILQNILNKFRTYNFEFSNQRITFSAGIAKYTENLTSAEFFESADKTMYKAKQNGKNHILISKISE